MKITKSDIHSMEVGQTKSFTLSPREMLSGRSYVYQQSMVLGWTFRTKYNRRNNEFLITRYN